MHQVEELQQLKKTQDEDKLKLLNECKRLREYSGEFERTRLDLAMSRKLCEKLQVEIKELRELVEEKAKLAANPSLLESFGKSIAEFEHMFVTLSTWSKED